MVLAREGRRRRARSGTTIGMPRVVLLLSCLLFLAAGLAFLIAPETMTAQVDIHAATPTGVADIRAVYGGLEPGLAAVLFTHLWGHARDPAQLPRGLTIALFALSGMALARLVGIALDGPQRAITWPLWAGEVIGALLCWVALRQLATTRTSA